MGMWGAEDLLGLFRASGASVSHSTTHGGGSQFQRDAWTGPTREEARGCEGAVLPAQQKRLNSARWCSGDAKKRCGGGFCTKDKRPA